MQTVHDTTLEGVRPFFGSSNDTRGEYFTTYNYIGSEFGVGVTNNLSDNLLIESEPVFQLLLAKNYKNNEASTDFYIHEDMIDLIINTACFHKMIDSDAKLGIDESKPYVKYLLNTVYTGWNNLSSDVRKFYSTFLHLLVKTPTGWVTPPAGDVSVTARLNPEEIRLNMAKVKKDVKNSGILFAETLPKITNIVKGVKITYEGIVYHTDFVPNVDNSDILKKIYNNVYTTNSLEKCFPSIWMSDHEFKFIDTDLRPFSLDFAKLTKSILTSRTQHGNVSAKQSKASEAAKNKDNFDDIFTSLTTGVTFKRKDGNLYRIDGEEETLLDDAQFEKDVNESCYGTKLTSDCDVVFRCLLTGEPKNLSRCLGKLKNQDMFKVAQREVEKMNPKVALQLLKTFGFNVRKEVPTGLVLPPSFEEWVQNILPRSVDEETRKTIIGNQQLMNYLKGVVSLIRNNPDIIDKGNQKGPMTPSQYAQRAGLNTFIQPKTVGDRATLSASILEQGVLLSHPSINTFPLGGLFNNVSNIGMMGTQPFMLQGGGVKPQCVNASMLTDMFTVTFSEMERNGKILVEADKKRITESIKRIERLEEQLIKILEDLKLFSKLNTSFNIGRYPVGEEEVSLNEVVGASSAASITGEAVNNLKNCASQNITEQSRLMYDLISKINHSLVGTLVGNDKNSLLDRV
jgi:hypothetical protein